MKAILHYSILALAFIVLSAGGCEDSSPAPSVTLPSNLTVSVEQTEGTGKVTVLFSAEKANFYRVFFGDSKDSEKVTTNKVFHTYAQAGTYTIKVQAHTTEAAFIEESETVEVQFQVDDSIIPSSGYTTPEQYSGMTLVWQDEFNGTQLNEADWTYEIGTGSGGWGNNELQYYRRENTTVRDGHLIIEARKEGFGGMDYTSSRIKTQGKKNWKYGRIDIRAALPEGQGIWPALWMLGESINTVGWPKCGEIDIMEMVGKEPNTIHGTIHWWNANNSWVYYGKEKTLASGALQSKFHVFSIVWTPTSITWYVDDTQFNVVDTTPADLSEFQEEFFLLFNVAVGGNWPGSPDATSTYPQHMVVDYVRVFQNQ